MDYSRPNRPKITNHTMLCISWGNNNNDEESENDNGDNKMISKAYYSSNLDAYVCENCEPDCKGNTTTSFYVEKLESDTPKHCVKCGVLLPFSLTDEGRNYVKERVVDFLTGDRGSKKIIKEWAGYYGDVYDLSIWKIDIVAKETQIFPQKDDAIQFVITRDFIDADLDQIADLRKEGKMTYTVGTVYLREIKLFDIAILLESEDE